MGYRVVYRVCEARDKSRVVFNNAAPSDDGSGAGAVGRQAGGNPGVQLTREPL